ncbi:hypothetical protein TNCV_1788841 [Trichonephila clavipes]|nr:hypothetical protein TNCV_1788841 [Trichonephila clavipes]
MELAGEHIRAVAVGRMFKLLQLEAQLSVCDVAAVAEWSRSNQVVSIDTENRFLTQVDVNIWFSGPRVRYSEARSIFRFHRFRNDVAVFPPPGPDKRGSY